MAPILLPKTDRLTFGENELGGKLGFITTLHTWDQKLNTHFHLHCLVAGGAISPDGSRWTPCKGNKIEPKGCCDLRFVQQIERLSFTHEDQSCLLVTK